MKKQKINTGMLFERHEEKFLVPPDKYHVMMEALSSYMTADQYGLHTINTIYYDTDDYQLIRQSLDKPKFKQKLRLRSYGQPGPDSDVYLELKKKFDSVTYKRRIMMTYEHALDYLNDGIVPIESKESQENIQTFGEIDWFASRQVLGPKVLLSYDRVALYGLEDMEFRMTFDANIRWRDHHLDMGKGDYGNMLLQPGVRLLEIKAMGAYPLWLCRLLSELELYPQSFSKYGTVYTQYIMNHEINQEREVIQIAG